MRAPQSGHERRGSAHRKARSYTTSNGLSGIGASTSPSRTRSRWLPSAAGLALAAALALAGCSRAPESASGAVALQTCRLPGVETAARCGTYEVWEDREARSGRRIRLDIAIMPARVRAREADPIFVLAGGPGQGAVSLASQVLPLFARLNDVRDIVLVDQRGTGNSNPLDCEDDEEPALQSLFEDTLPEPLVARCLAALDADPRLYMTSIAVEDLDEVRAALGYARINLWGG